MGCAKLFNKYGSMSLAVDVSLRDADRSAKAPGLLYTVCEHKLADSLKSFGLTIGSEMKMSGLVRFLFNSLW